MVARLLRVRVAVLLVPVALAAVARAAESERVTFKTSDHVVIVADYYPPKPAEQGSPMVILLHMYRSDRTAWKPLVDPLHEAGFAILAIDLRGHGESETDELRRRVAQRDTAVFQDMFLDVRAAYDWLARQQEIDRSRFALVGASVGCSVSLRYAARDKSVDAVVCLSPGTHYLGLDSKTDIAEVKGRNLWLIAAEDEREKQGVMELAPLSEGVKTTLVPGKEHGTRLFGKAPGLEERIAEYLQEHAGRETKTTVYGSINSDIYHLAGSGWIERIKPTNLRYYSSPQEAEQRGLRKARSRGPEDWGRDRRP